MNQNLNGKSVAILVTDGFEQSELEQPRQALEDAGAETTLISPNDDEVKGWSEDDFGDTFTVDLPLSQAHAQEFDALLLPGGVMNPDKLYQTPLTIRL